MKQESLSVTNNDPFADSRPTAIYVHGLASGAYSRTFRDISLRFPQFMWAMAEFGEDLAENVEHLNRLIAQLNPALIVGTSMGGLTVLYADAPEAVKIVCNPALSIADCVRNRIGLGTHPYLCARLDDATEFELTEEMCRKYERYIATHKPLLGRDSYAIFAANDELLGVEASARAQLLLAECGYTTIVDPDGQHRLQPSTLNIFAKNILDNEYFSGM